LVKKFNITFNPSPISSSECVHEGEPNIVNFVFKCCFYIWSYNIKIEKPPNKKSDQERNEKNISQEYILLSKNLSESKEIFPFPGINQEDYINLKKTDEEYPGFVTPIDELLEKFKFQGMKVVLSPTDPESGNVFILPAESNNIIEDSLSPKYLIKENTENLSLRRLIEINKDKK
jgi:hypothetical protein